MDAVDDFHMLLAHTFFKERRLRFALHGFYWAMVKSKRRYVIKVFTALRYSIRCRLVESNLLAELRNRVNRRYLHTLIAAVLALKRNMSHMIVFRTQGYIKAWYQFIQGRQREHTFVTQLSRMRIVQPLVAWFQAHKVCLIESRVSRLVFCTWNTHTRSRIHFKRLYFDQWILASSEAWELAIGKNDKRELRLVTSISKRAMEASLRAITTAYHRYDSPVRLITSTYERRLSNGLFRYWSMASIMQMTRKFHTRLLVHVFEIQISEQSLSRSYVAIKKLCESKAHDKRRSWRIVIQSLRNVQEITVQRHVCDVKMGCVHATRKQLIWTALIAHYYQLIHMNSIRAHIDQTLYEGNEQRKILKLWWAVTNSKQLPNYC